MEGCGISRIVFYKNRVVDIETEIELFWKESAMTETKWELPYWAYGKSEGGVVTLAAIEFVASSDRRWPVSSTFIFE